MFELASRQHGIVTRRQLLEVGYSASAVDRRVRMGALVRLHPGVFKIGGNPSTREQVLMASVLAVSPEAVVSHSSAAGLWGLLSWPRTVHVMTTRSRWRPKQFSVHRTADLDAGHVTRVDGIPVTTPARTVVDLGSVAGRRTVGVALDGALRANLTSLLEVASVIDDVSRQGRTGVGIARDLLMERQEWTGSTESPLEDLFRQIIEDAALPQPTPQLVVRDRYGVFIGRVDFGYPNQRLAIELDGYQYHSDPGTFASDRVRQNALITAGYRLLRYTARDLRSTPSRVAAEVAGFLTDLSNGSVG